ncbi:TPA: hypothetical protein N0F65_006728 [Lagenidium giganteum]|uniref:Ubiquitin-like protease family profile domain-containing protein n=1 Tax=Lagenidium giganteum TaxID=4803 RepID=A0AAV2Z7X9_9STRA|nr:TPA: hypothetical protein N0F65_006728 [Lagenidium giganteum]
MPATAVNSTHCDALAASTAVAELQEADRVLVAHSLRPIMLIALHFEEPDHWCGIVVDFQKRMLTKFDPYQCQSRYAQIDRWSKQFLYPVIPGINDHRFKCQKFTSVTQRDSYNCGVLVLLFFEFYLQHAPGVVLTAKDLSTVLRHARYRYLCLTLEDALLVKDGNSRNSNGK